MFIVHYDDRVEHIAIDIQEDAIDYNWRDDVILGYLLRVQK